MQNFAVTFQEHIQITQYINGSVTIWSRSCTPRYALKINENKWSPKKMYNNAQSSIIFNTQKVEMAPLSINWCMDYQKWYILLVEISNKNKVMIHDTTWINLDSIRQVKEASHKWQYIIWFDVYAISKIVKPNHKDRK